MLPAVLSGNGWSLTAGLPTGANMADGAYHITAFAYDRAGNSSRADSDFTKAPTDTKVPVIAITAPTPGSNVLALPKSAAQYRMRRAAPA